MERARELLGENEVSIKEIGFELGFKTHSHFNVAFRRQFGMPPQEYRAKQAVPFRRIPPAQNQPPFHGLWANRTFPYLEAGRRYS